MIHQLTNVLHRFDFTRRDRILSTTKLKVLHNRRKFGALKTLTRLFCTDETKESTCTENTSSILSVNSCQEEIKTAIN